MTDPLHPQSMWTLEQLVKLHGVKAVITAVNEIRRREVAAELRRRIERLNNARPYFLDEKSKR